MVALHIIFNFQKGRTLEGTCPRECFHKGCRCKNLLVFHWFIVISSQVLRGTSCRDQILIPANRCFDENV